MGEQIEERRKHPRLNLKLSVAFRPQAEPPKREGKGTTLNVSAGGACFETAEWSDLAPEGQMEMRLSGFSRYGSGSLFRELHAAATVMRLDPPAPEVSPLERARVRVRFDEPPHFEIYDWGG